MTRAKNEVLHLAGFLCGIIRDKEDSMMGDLRYVNDLNLMYIREDRMLRMLMTDTIMRNKMWNDFGLSERHVIEDVYYNITDWLIDDLIEDFLH